MSVTTRYTLVCDDCGRAVDLGANPYARPDGWTSSLRWGGPYGQTTVLTFCARCTQPPP